MDSCYPSEQQMTSAILGFLSHLRKSLFPVEQYRMSQNGEQ